MTEEFKDLVGFHHVLLLTNVVLFVVISFISWDVLWWWNMGDWAGGARVLFLLVFGVVNGFACGSYYEWKKTRAKNK